MEHSESEPEHVSDCYQIHAVLAEEQKSHNLYQDLQQWLEIVPEFSHR